MPVSERSLNILAEVSRIAVMAARMLWFAQMTSEAPASSKVSVGVEWYLVGTSTTGARLAHSFMNVSTSSAFDFLEWIKIASAPAAW